MSHLRARVLPLLSSDVVPLFGTVANSPSACYFVYERSVLDRPEAAALIEWLAKSGCIAPHRETLAQAPLDHRLEQMPQDMLCRNRR
jgi:hypothetical protein